MDDRAIKLVRIALGIAGFLILVGTAPCLFWMIGEGYAAPTDTSGVFGGFGLAAFAIFVGITFLYYAFKSSPESSDSKGPDKRGADGAT